MIGQRVPMSRATFEKLAKQLEHLKMVERPTIIKEIAETRANGDLSENAEYHAAREKQGHIEAQISIIQDKMARAEIIEVDVSSSDKIVFGATVTAKNLTSGKSVVYTLVGPEGVNLQEGKISSKSPIGQALMGKKVGEVTKVSTPKGEIELEVIEFH